VLLHHVVVVEQPLAGGADVPDVPDVPGAVRVGEPGVGVLEDLAGSIETPEEWGLPPGSPTDSDALTGRDFPGPLGQALGA
jgi:hypothetical protein